MRRPGSASILAAVLVLAAATQAARANCLPNKTLTSWGSDGYFYVNMPAGANNINVIGRFWQTGGRAIANEGTFDDPQWLRLCPAESCGTEKWYILGELGTAGVLGCPAGSLTLTVDTLSGHNLTVELDETPATFAFDLSRFGTDLSFGAKPRPVVRSAHREGATIVLELGIDPQSGGIYSLGSAVAAAPTYRLMSATSASDPGPLAATYTPGPIITPGTLVPFNMDCTQPGLDQWLAIQTIVDGVSSDTVGQRSRLSCNILAEPEYKHVDRPVRPERRGR